MMSFFPNADHVYAGVREHLRLTDALHTRTQLCVHHRRLSYQLRNNFSSDLRGFYEGEDNHENEEGCGGRRGILRYHRVLSYHDKSEGI